MTVSRIRNILCTAVAGVGVMALTACNGIFDDIYDRPASEVRPARGQLVIDATSWTNWYYVDLKRLHQLGEEGDEEALAKAQTSFEAYPIPMSLTGQTDGRSGQYMYWFDVFGAGLSKNELREYTPTDPQPQPGEWTFAVHRNNVRTNGGAAFKTRYTSMDELPPTSDEFRNAQFTPDEWTENEVWDSQTQMLRGLVPSQGIAINRTLSAWLKIEVPPMPPAFTIDSHVFVLRLADGTYAALQLENYLSPSGTKCWLTINYKYPY